MDAPLALPGPLEPPTCDDRAVWDVWLSRLELPAVRIADELGLFGRLAAGPASAAAVAAALDLGPRGAAALLAVGAALGFLTQHGGRFGLTAAARHFLLPGSDFYWGAMLHLRQGQVDPLQEALLAALRRDAHPAAAAPADPRPVAGWARGQVDAALARETTARMHAHSFPAALGAARHGDFAGVTRLLDVGGGSGCVLIALAQRHPGLRCTVLELPAVCPVAAAYLTRYGVADRVDTWPADMFVDPWPRGYDAVFLGNILHDWDAPRRAALARKSFAALPPGGRLYLYELLLADTRDGPRPAALFSLAMLLVTYGQQLTLGELETLLGASGFVDVRATQTYGYYSLVSARKP